MTGVWQSWDALRPKTDRPVLVKAIYENTSIMTYRVFFWDKEEKHWFYGCSTGASTPVCKLTDEFLKTGAKRSMLIPIEWTEIPE